MTTDEMVYGDKYSDIIFYCTNSIIQNTLNTLENSEKQMLIVS